MTSMLILKEEHVEEIVDILGSLYLKNLDNREIDSEVIRLSQWVDRIIVKKQIEMQKAN